VRELRLPRLLPVWLLAGAADLLLLGLRVAGLEARWVGLLAILLFALSAFLVAAWIGAIVFFGREQSSKGLGYVGVLAVQALFLLVLLKAG